MEQIYCSVSEIVEDVGQLGISEAAVMGKIQAASQFILKEIGQFLPVLETRYFEGEGDDELLVPPLLKVTSILNQGVTLQATDYLLQPDGRRWRNGPYDTIELYDLGSALAWSELDRGVVVPGWWGMYDEAVSVQLSAVSQLIGDTTLVVSDGSKVSPGMVLLIGAEWELVTGTGAATAAGTTLSVNLDESAEEMKVSDGTKVNVGETIKVDFELMRVLDVSGNLVNVARGINGTARRPHSLNTAVMALRTFSVVRGANGSTAAAHTSAAVSRQVAPADVNYLCRQIAALMINKAKTNFSGRGGNDEAGTGFWVNEFPKNQIEAVKSNYFWGGV